MPVFVRQESTNFGHATDYCTKSHGKISLTGSLIELWIASFAAPVGPDGEFITCMILHRSRAELRRVHQ